MPSPTERRPSTTFDLAAVLAGLTSEEKLALLDGEGLWSTTPVRRLGIPAITLSDGPNGLRTQAPDAEHSGVLSSLPATCFPPAVALASTWDTGMVREVGTALARECRASGVSVLLGPGINIKRAPLCGRNFEYFSEDPLITGALAAAFVDGLQSQGVGATVKHFAANNQETDRMAVSADIDERPLREIYLRAFETVVRTARPWAVMCAYNRINGVFAAENSWLLTEVLRQQWGFAGLVMSDWGAVAHRERAVAAGLDLEMPSSTGRGAAAVRQALEDGRLAQADVDRCARRVLDMVDCAVSAPASREEFDPVGHHEVARRAAVGAAVLLKNDGGILPLSRRGGPVAVIGEFARTPRFQGAGSSQVNPLAVDTALDCLTAALEPGREVVFAPGFRIADGDAEDEAPTPEALLTEAIEAARTADVVVMFLGLPAAHESEAFDRTHMDLPDVQLDVLRAVANINKNVAVVLSNGGVVNLEPWQASTRAVLEGWLLGQAGGRALADLLVGDESPSGRLAETIPLRYEDNPTLGNFPGEFGHVRYGEGLLVGYRWYDAHRLDVAYPFGHGLTYTTFDYSALAVDVRDSAAPQVTVSVQLTNSGGRAGREVVQLYVRPVGPTVHRPEQELRAFAKVALDPGESKQVVLHLRADAFAYWHPRAHRWVIDGGKYKLHVGASSRDIRLTETVSLPGEEILVPLTAESPCGDWLDDAVAGPRIMRTLTGRFRQILDDPEAARLHRPIPMFRMLRFPGFTIDEDQLTQWADEANAVRAKAATEERSTG
ncbi:glycoside hydrolase family 3 C-terminal domain-containing protein [Streptomyces aculeolatus]